MSEVSAVFSDRKHRLRHVLGRQFWVIALIVTLGIVATLTQARLQVPQHEAFAVVQVQTGIDAASVAAHVLGRDNLLAIAARQGLSGAGGNRDKLAVLMRQAVAINNLRSDAGVSLGFPAQVAGVVVSVLLPDAETSARVANDLAQQILDYGNSGRLDQTQEPLDFLRRDELRLWQEVSALTAEQERAAVVGTVGALDAAVAGRRQVMLMQDQYDVVRQKLAEAEIAARLSLHLQADQFSLLRRATAGDALRVVQHWMLPGIAASLVLGLAVAFVLERVTPGVPTARAPGRPGRMAHIYRAFDDPARPILGMPRYLVTTSLIVVWLWLLAGFIR